MDCLNQFQFYILQSITFSSTGFSSYSSGTNVVFTGERGLPANTFRVEGFKNINLYGIELCLNVVNGIINTNQGIIEDFNFGITYTGQNPSISGNFNPNGLSMNSYTNEIYLGKYKTKMIFQEPIKSVNNISIASLSCQGYSPQNLTSLQVDIKGNIFFYYKYEGEDD